MSRKKEAINIALLMQTASIQSYSNDEKEMISFVKGFAVSQGLTHTTDAYGNVYITKGQGPYPVFVAHLDTVHSIIPNYRIHKQGDTLFAFNGTTGRQYGIGGDDKVGVFCNMQALLDFRNVKAVFFRNEEIGCLGSGNADMSFFNDCNFAIQFDRRGNSDLITEVGGVPLCSTVFYETIKPYMDSIGYKKTSGLSTDVATLKRKGLGISAINLSCGYHDPHSNTEIIKISEVDRIYRTIKKFTLEHCQTKFDHVYEPPKYTSSRDYRTYDSYVDDEIYGSYLEGSTYRSYARKAYKNFANMYKYNNKVFKHVGDTCLEMEDHKCPLCKEKTSIYFMPNEIEFYCSSCNMYITNPGKLFASVKVEDSGSTFVFSWINNQWYKIQDAVWVQDLNTYALTERINK